MTDGDARGAREQVSAGGDVSMALTASNRLFVWYVSFPCEARFRGLARPLDASTDGCACPSRRGDNSKGQLGVCGCGGCAEYGGGDTGSCTLTSVGETCPCNCGGLGTCYQISYPRSQSDPRGTIVALHCCAYTHVPYTTQSPAPRVAVASG